MKYYYEVEFRHCIAIQEDAKSGQRARFLNSRGKSYDGVNLRSERTGLPQSFWARAQPDVIYPITREAFRKHLKTGKTPQRKK